MALTKEQKEKIVEELKQNIARQKAMVFVDFTGLKTADLLELKDRLAEVKAILKICKKTLLNLAFKEKKIEADAEKLEGQLAVVFAGQDEIGPLKKVYQFSQENENLKILAGFVQGEARDKEYIEALAKIPSREELWARLVGSVCAPMANLVNVLQANIKGLIYVLAKAKM